MKPVQWLLVGGPHHGSVLNVQIKPRVMCDGTNYEGTNFLHRSQVYRVGYASVDDMRPGIVQKLIVQKQLRPLAEEFV